jgi:hypothetical protein
MNKTVKITTPIIYKSSSDLYDLNLIIPENTLVLESDTKILKIGDGVTAYNSLSENSKLLNDTELNSLLVSTVIKDDTPEEDSTYSSSKIDNKLEDLKEYLTRTNPNLVTIDSISIEEDEDGSEARPYRSWASFTSTDKYNSHLIVRVIAGSDLSQEDIVINLGYDEEPIQATMIIADSSPDNIWCTIGNLTINEGAGDILIKGFEITGNLTLEGEGSIVLENCLVHGQIQGYTNNGYLSFYHCTFQDNVNFSASEEVEDFTVYIENCWGDEMTDEYPTITLNIEDAQLEVYTSTELKINRLQGNVAIKDSLLYGYNSANTPGKNVFLSGTCNNSEGSEGYDDLAPITLNGTADIFTGTFQFKRTGSILQGNWIEAGVGSLQVRENQLRPGYTARIDPSDGTTRANPNLLKDHLNGISDSFVDHETKLKSKVGITDITWADNILTFTTGSRTNDENISVNLGALSAGVQSVAVDGSNLVFYDGPNGTGNAIGLIPLSDLSSYTGGNSISINEGVISLVLSSDSDNGLEINQDGFLGIDETKKIPLLTEVEKLQDLPTNEVLQSTYVAQVPNKYLSTNDFTTTAANKLSGLANITNVNNINKLSLSNGTLALATETINIVDYDALIDKSGSWDVTWDPTVPDQMALVNTLFPSAKLATDSQTVTVPSDSLTKFTSVTYTLREWLTNITAKINGILTYNSATNEPVTLNSSYISSGGCTLRKKSGIVTMTITGQNKIALAHYTAIGTLPVGYRPGTE